MEIVGWDRDEAYVSGELDDLSDGLRFEVDGDRTLIREGLVWLDVEAARRYGLGTRFRDLSPARKDEICSDIAHIPEAAPGFESGARFFARVRDLTAGAFWTTEEGMQDLQYIGNVPLERWDPPPPEVLEFLGLA